MEYRVEISKRQRRMRIRVEGAYDLAMTLHAIGEIADDPRFEPDFSILIDLRGMDSEIPRFEQLEAGAAVTEMRRESFRGPVAVVSQPGEFFDVIRLGASRALLFDITARPFVDLAAAEAWLDSFGPR